MSPLYICCLLAFACQDYVNKVIAYLYHLQDEWHSGNVSSGVHLGVVVIKTVLRGREVVVGTCSSHGADTQWLELPAGSSWHPKLSTYGRLPRRPLQTWCV